MRQTRELVSVQNIPRQTEDVPLDNPLAVFKLAKEMQKVCDDHDGVGLAAVQVGVPWKFFIVKGLPGDILLKENEYGYFVNCEYHEITTSKPFVSIEGCLSLRSDQGQLRSFWVERLSAIHLKGLRLIDKKNGNLKFEQVDVEIDVEQSSIVYQHEIDHQNGLLIEDIGHEWFFMAPT